MSYHCDLDIWAKNQGLACDMSFQGKSPKAFKKAFHAQRRFGLDKQISPHFYSLSCYNDLDLWAKNLGLTCNIQASRWTKALNLKILPYLEVMVNTEPPLWWLCSAHCNQARQKMLQVKKPYLHGCEKMLLKIDLHCYQQWLWRNVYKCQSWYLIEKCSPYIF